MSNGIAHGELTLFDCPRIRKSEYWQFIKLVAPHAQPPENQTHWLSQDATDAYCLRCSKMFRFTKGSSNSVRRHMERYHRKELLKRQVQAAQDAKKITLVGAKKSAAANATPPRRGKRAMSAQDAELLADDTGMMLSTSPALVTAPLESTVAIPAVQAGPKRHRVDAVGSSRHGVESLVKWLSLSLRPFSIVDDAGFSSFAEAISGEQPFVVPTREALRHRLELMSENARFEVKQKLKKDVGHFALSAEIWRARVADADASTTVDSHATIKCWYLSEEFAMQSLVLDAVRIENLSAERLCQLLQDVGLAKASMSLLLLPEGCKLQHDTATAEFRHVVDVAEILDALVRNSLQKNGPVSASRSPEHLEVSATDDAKPQTAQQTVHSALSDVMQFITWIRTDSIAHAKLEQLFPPVPLELTRFPALESSDWSLQIAHDVITRAISLRSAFDGLVDRWDESAGDAAVGSPPEKIKPSSWMVLEGLVILWRPLHEVVQVTTNEKVCSLPFMLPILTMAKQLFERVNLFEDLKQRHTAATSDTPGVIDSVAAALGTMQAELLGGLNSHFGALCSSLPWISALDPRYARLRHLSDDERELCKQQLLEHAAELYKAQLPPLPSQIPTTDPLGSLAHPDFDAEMIYGDARATGAGAGVGAASMPGLMHRLLYDEEEDLPASADAALTREAEIAQARLFIANEIAMYFNEHQLRKTRIACPLQWWSAHRERFSFLAPLARLWLSTRASLAAANASDCRVLSSELCESLGSKEAKENWAKLASDLIVLRAHLMATPMGSVSL